MVALILYVFHQYNSRVQFFLDHGLFNHPDYKFLIIANDPNVSLTIPSYVELIRRENKGFDFGGWSDALLANERWRTYDRFLFLNSSVIGPYLNLQDTAPWPEKLFSLLTGDVRLAGTTINAHCDWVRQMKGRLIPHVQSMTFAMDRNTVELLISTGIFSSKYETDFHKTILNREVQMSQDIFNAGGNIACLMPCYKGRDFRKPPTPSGPTYGDINRPGDISKYFKNPQEALFIKGNRGDYNSWLSQ